MNIEEALTKVMKQRMTKAETKKVFEILSEADGGCPVCVRSLNAEFIKRFNIPRELAEECMRGVDYLLTSEEIIKDTYDEDE